MTVKSQTRFFPSLLSNRQYSGTISTLLYNWPIFAGALFYGLIASGVSFMLSGPWSWLFWASGLAVLLLTLSILIATFIVYDWGRKREYDRLAELSHLSQANVVLDITCGKLRGTRGLLSQFQHGHYFLIDIYDAEKMTDHALRRARDLEPPLQTNHRIYRRPGTPGNLPVPHNWADVIYCNFSLHEIQGAASRDAIFTEFARVLKPDGKLVIAEHGRDLLNFAVFGPGVFSFFSPATWNKHIAKAGLTIQHRERWRGLVHLWVVGRNSR
jgi:ubiquinone/menaquinone biosynthesis C-methylase UbiE